MWRGEDWGVQGDVVTRPRGCFFLLNDLFLFFGSFFDTTVESEANTAAESTEYQKQGVVGWLVVGGR
jgi:hypothetical protein